MEHATNDSKKSSRSTLTTRIAFRSLLVVFMVIAILFGYSATRMNQGGSFYDGGTRRSLKAVRDNRTHIANIENSHYNSSSVKEEIDFDLRDAIEIKGTERKSYINETTSTKRKSSLSEAKIILIIAYMRTGSTLTGAIFQSFSETFYVFEPIRKLIGFFIDIERNNTKQRVLKFANGTKRNVLVGERNDMVLEEINDWLNCKLTSLSTISLNNFHHSHHTNIMGKFTDCIKTQEKKQNPNSDKCFDQAIRLCKKAPLRTIKFIRLSMKDAAKLLPLYTNMKIIHLLRDPRGIMSSRFKIGEASRAKIKTEAKKHCTTVDKDLKTSKEIITKFPGRLKIVRYEDLAERPLETSESMFKFSGLPFNEFVQNFINNQTNAQQDSGNYFTERKNSSFTASKWRTWMKFSVSNILYKTCLKSNIILGYLPFRSEEFLRNLRIASRNTKDVEKELIKSIF